MKIVIVGDGKIGYYLARQMLDVGAHVKIIERDRAVCDSLAVVLPDAEIICGDGTDYQLLGQEQVESMDTVAALTGLDEQNILMSLFVRGISRAKVITKVNRDSYSEILEKLEVGSVFSPRFTAAEVVTRYVRAMANSKGSNVETLYKLAGDQAEALEFRVSPEAKVCGVPLVDLPIRQGVLLGSINRGTRVIIPQGQDTIQPGDTVVVVTTLTSLDDLDDILECRR